MEAVVIGITPGGKAIVEHDGMTEWADCSVCGAHLDGASPDAPDDWDGACWECGAVADRVGLGVIRCECGQAEGK